MARSVTARDVPVGGGWLACEPPRWRLDAAEALRRWKRGDPLVFVDARREPEWRRAQDKLPSAVRLAPDSADETLPLIPRGRTTVVYCTTGGEASSQAAANALLTNGCRDVHVLAGGLAAWRGAGGPTEPAHAGSARGLSARRA